MQGYLGSGRGVGLSRGPRLGVGLCNFLRTVDAALGFVFGKSCGCTGSARRTSGSDALGCGIGEGALTVGCVVGVIATAGAGLAAFSTGKAWGAIIFSGAAVAAGEAPATGRGFGLRR